MINTNGLRNEDSVVYGKYKFQWSKNNKSLYIFDAYTNELLNSIEGQKELEIYYWDLKDMAKDKKINSFILTQLNLAGFLLDWKEKKEEEIIND